jgi:hypothetical protein
MRGVRSGRLKTAKGLVFIVAMLMLPGARADAVAAAEEPFIAGVKPHERPAGAPVVRTYEKDGKWYARALRGISEPYPYSLRFLEDQGPWYTPFIHAGMRPPYDIRGLHAKPEHLAK